MYLIIVLDVSGSMEGRKIDQLQEAMKTILSEIQPEDYFSVIEYSSIGVAWNMYTGTRYETWCNAFSSEYVGSARTLADQMVATGSTNMLDGLDLAFSCLNHMPSGHKPVMVMLTDGQPDSTTSRVFETAFSLNHKDATNPDDLKVSLYTLALGYDADISFLKELAANNGGSARQIYEASDASKQLEDFYLTISKLLLTDVSFTFNYQEVDQQSLTTSGFRSYFEGSELVVAGKMLSSDVSEITGVVVGHGENGKSITYPIKVSTNPLWKPETLGGQPSSERLWAFLKTSQLIDSAMLDDEEETVNATIAQALSYSFVTPYTCLIMDIGEDYAVEASTAASSTTAKPSSPPQPNPTGSATTRDADDATWSAVPSSQAPPSGRPSTSGPQSDSDHTTAAPGQPTATPGGPTATPGQPTATPGGPTATPGQPTATPGQPTASPGRPTGTPGQPTATPGRPTGTPGHPTATPGQPTPTQGRPTGTPGQPTPTPGRPTPTPGHPLTPSHRPPTPSQPTPPGRPTPPGPPGSSRPPRPADGSVVSSQINIGNVAIQSVSFNGPLVQFNFR